MRCENAKLATVIGRQYRFEYLYALETFHPPDHPLTTRDKFMNRRKIEADVIGTAIAKNIRAHHLRVTSLFLDVISQ